jgi:hypothetical protein
MKIKIKASYNKMHIFTFQMCKPTYVFYFIGLCVLHYTNINILHKYQKNDKLVINKEI